MPATPTTKGISATVGLAYFVWCVWQRLVPKPNPHLYRWIIENESPPIEFTTKTYWPQTCMKRYDINLQAHRMKDRSTFTHCKRSCRARNFKMRQQWANSLNPKNREDPDSDLRNG